MDFYKTLIYTTFGSLLILLVVQIVWTNQLVTQEEHLFSNRVELALVSVKEDLEEDSIASESMIKESMKGGIKQKTDTKAQKKRRLSRVDQLLKENLLRYNIKLDYDFDLINNQEAAHQKSRYILSKGWYYTRMEDILVDKGIQLKLKFPSRDQFLFTKLFGMFLISALLILAVAISIIIMLRLYNREHTLAQKTKDFVNNMTHELKTPLANIGLANNLAQKQVTMIENDRLNNYLQIIESEKCKLQSLADDILTIAVLENVNTRSSFEKVDMHTLISKVSHDSLLIMEDRNGTLDLDLKADNFYVFGSLKRLTNVLTNLIDNSIKYNIHKPEIKISTQNIKNHFVLTVKDNGIGIKKEDLKHIVEKYYRASTGNLHDTKGFGLGLTFVKLVIDEHNGSIKIKSAPGEGTEVKIEIPINK